MATTDKTIITTAGRSMLVDLDNNKAHANGFNIYFSTGDLTGMTDDQLVNLQDIQSKDIKEKADVIHLDQGDTKIRAQATYTGNQKGIYINTYATYAVDDQGNELLFALYLNSEPQYLLASTADQETTQGYGFNVGISQTENVNFTKLSNITATLQDVKQMIDGEDAVTLHESQSIPGNKNFTGDLQYKGNEVATTNDTNNSFQNSVNTAKAYTDSKRIYYNINNYGAQANNPGFDNAPIINSIINSLPANGGTILIPEGDYYINSSINVNSNYVHLMGINNGFRSNIDAEIGTGNLHPGGGSKLIINNTSSTAIQIGTSNGTPRISGVEIDHLRIIGINYDPTNCSTTAINIAQNNDGIMIHNNAITNVMNGIIMFGSDCPMIKDNYLCELANSIKLLGSSQHAQITGNEMGAQPTGITLQLDGATNALIANNNIYPDGQDNIVLNNCTMCSINGNVIKSYYAGMINIVGGNDNSITNNQMYAQMKNGQWAEDPIGRDHLWGLIFISSDSTSIIGNHITSEQPGPNTRVNIHTGTDCRLFSNMINGTVSTAAVVVAKVCQNTIVAYSANTGEINDIGTNTSIITAR